MLAAVLLEEPAHAEAQLVVERDLRDHRLDQNLVRHPVGGGEDRQQPVVVGLDRAFTYDKLRAAVRAVRAGALLVGTNPDLLLPVEGGPLDPGAGSLLAAIASAAGVRPVVVGKPDS